MNETLTALVDEIRALVDPCRILLYGTKQDPARESLREVNLCLVVCHSPKEAETLLYRRLESDLAFNLLVYGQEDWDRLVADPTSYAASIAAKGVCLYGKA